MNKKTIGFHLMLSSSLFLLIGSLFVPQGLLPFNFILLANAVLVGMRLYLINIIAIPALVIFLVHSISLFIVDYSVHPISGVTLEPLAQGIILLIPCLMYLVGVILVVKSIFKKSSQVPSSG